MIGSRSRSALVGAALAALAGTAAAQGAPPAAPQGAQPLRAEPLPDRVRVFVAGKLFTEYRYAAGQKLPHFFPVNGPLSGASVTTESSEPYPHHASLWFGSDFVNGGNYWQDSLSRGQIVAEETRVVRAQGEAVEIAQTNLWSRPGAPSPIRDRRTIRIAAPSASLRVIDFDVTLTPLIDVHIRKTNHSLFAARMARDLAVPQGGTLVNAHGDTGEKGTFGKPAPWADFWGRRSTGAEGLAILSHPANPWSPAPWFTRDYGFMSPTPFNWMENGLDLPAGKEVRLRYRVIVHAGTTDEAKIAEHYRQYAESR